VKGREAVPTQAATGDFQARRGSPDALLWRYRVGVLGNCCTHGEFVVDALRKEAGAELVAGWEVDPRRAPALARALGVPLRPDPDALIGDPAIDVVAVCCDPCEGSLGRAGRREAHLSKQAVLREPRRLGP